MSSMPMHSRPAQSRQRYGADPQARMRVHHAGGGWAPPDAARLSWRDAARRWWYRARSWRPGPLAEWPRDREW